MRSDHFQFKTPCLKDSGFWTVGLIRLVKCLFNHVMQFNGAPCLPAVDIMSAVKSGSSLRALVLTPERIPDFFVPSRSTLLCLSPRFERRSSDRTRLLSDPDKDSQGDSPTVIRLTPAAPRHFLRRLPSPRVRPDRRPTPLAAETDPTTRAALSLPHVGKVTTPYGFRDVLAASPCTRRRESLFHQKKEVTLTVTDCDPQDPAVLNPCPSRSPPVGLRCIKALGLQVMKELQRPAISLKARSPAMKRTRPR